MSTTQSGTAQRQHIMDVALSLMAQRGVDGTSMRDLASAANLNVASLYHYFPSKRDLLVAVLEERGFLGPDVTWEIEPVEPETTDGLTALLDDMLQSMLLVEDFIRLMLGEVMRGDVTAVTVGQELLASTQESLEKWLVENESDLPPDVSPQAVAHLMRTVVVGLFFEHVTGVFDDSSAGFHERAREIGQLLTRRAPAPGSKSE